MRFAMRDRAMRAATAATLAGLLMGCQPPQREVGDVWVRLPAVPGRPAAAYFHATGGVQDVAIVGVTSPRAGRAEMHESMAAGMRPIAKVEVEAGQDVRFSPAGRHVMLYDVDPRVKPGTTMPLRFAFSDGIQVTLDAKVVAAADPAPF